MPTETNSGATALAQSNIALVKIAQAEQQAVITAKRIEIIETLIEHKNIGGQDQIEESLLAIIEKFPNGISYPFLQTVFPDAALTAAREALKKARKIDQIGKKGPIILKLAEVK